MRSAISHRRLARVSADVADESGGREQMERNLLKRQMRKEKESAAQEAARLREEISQAAPGCDSHKQCRYAHCQYRYAQYQYR